ncbi:MAG TPA: MarR family transcriptional regulator [Patescibacteria group bacterium]|nr:MarR family transcriptional regulator [Patescibacteria group bacterium]
MFDDHDVEIWPREREPSRDARVIVAIHGARDAVSRRLAISSREHGLDPIESLVLGALLRETACPPWLLRQRLGLHRSTLSSILDRLERDGRVQRRKNSFDGRRFEILLTRAGAISADIAELIIRDVEAEIAGYTSPAQRHGAVAVFEACVAIGQRDRGSFD